MTYWHIVFGILLVVTAGIQSKLADADKVDDSLIWDCGKDVNVLIDRAYKSTRDNFKGRLNKKTATAGDLLAYVKQPVGASRNAIRAAENQGALLQLLAEKLKLTHHGPFNITDLLTPNQMELISQITGCASQLIPKVCTDSPYRTITGECNNRKYPSRGASNTGYIRLLPAEYEDGFSLPRGWTENKAFNGFSLPLARAVSNEIVQFPTESITLDKERALMFMQWGQWTDHDLDLAATSPARLTFFKSVDCETSCVRESPCFPLKIPANDPRIKNHTDCIPFFRSAPVCKMGSQVREQINTLTAYMDGSQLYGSDAPTAEKLRNNTNQLGLMAINQNFTDNGLPFLPFDTVSEDVCITANVSAGIPCFIAGDPRVSEQPGLTSFHTLFVREHNRIASELHKLNPKWSGETLYQETRKIIGGILQKITYKDWLPLLLGSELPNVLPPYKSYNESEDSSVANVFTIAFRMGHTLIQPFIYRLADKYRPYTPEPQTLLHKTFFSTWRVIQQGGIDPLLRGMMANRAKLNRQNQPDIDELRDHLFEIVQRIGLDLTALNMQRGRDHGLRGYNSWRRFCGLSAPSNLKELTSVLNNKELAKKFMDLYGTPENIDIWVGGVAEPLVPGGRIGKLLTCLIGNQFRRGQQGDRFYYENPSVFNAAQRSAIEKVTLARIICDNTKINEVPLNVFKGNSYPKDFVKCSKIPELNLKLWKAKCDVLQ
ncbi:myeloperoxidase-like isoform X3 [Pelobates fuscus]|uniref:myeloperoxidase-like isoform X3 n=1 Tax=Pelobates fuscus TaxID=191477 RepID=UPI002FE48170